MLVVAWRVAAEDLDVEHLQGALRPEPDVVWRRGEPGRHGPALDSGLSLSLDRRDDSLAHALEDIRRFLSDNRAILKDLRSRGIASCIDIGVGVGDSEHFTRSVRVPVADLAALADAGVELEISAYPCSDEDETERAS